VLKLSAVCALVVAILSSADGQDQEKKLLDRLLKPNMDLHNEAQNKKFLADGASTNKRASVGTYYVHQKSSQKKFSATGDFTAQQFNSQSFHSKRSIFPVSPHQKVQTSQSSYANQTAPGVRDAAQSDKKVATRDYAQNRPFLDEGKSQKSLNKQNAPMTIDQVRELLNKNK
jgi:hypothetical protein